MHMANAPERRDGVTHLDLAKCPTGIAGLDEITDGGLPRGRATLVCGSAGAGKTLLGLEFLVRGALEYGDPGVFMSFEESERDLTANVRSLGFDLDHLVSEKQLRIDFVRFERSEIEETGEYDLEGLFIRLGHAIDSIGAKRVVLDTIESLFSAFTDHATLRAELRRLFRWLKEKGVTAVISGERGRETNSLTRHGIEEYVADCVLLLDHRVDNQLSTRRIRVVKYRGSAHGTNEYPFMIGRRGISILPITSLGLAHLASRERVSTGIGRLDAMLDGRGVYRGSTTVVSGTAGTGKSSVATHFVEAACRRGEKCLYFAFEESPSQIVRNMESIGISLEPHVSAGLLRFQASRPTLHGLESHLAMVHQAIDEFQPAHVVLDPVTNFMVSSNSSDAYTMLLRLIDFLKGRGITTIITTLTSAHHPVEQSEANISSLIDTWILLRYIESNGERNRGLCVVKSRGMAHSNQVREYRLTDHGVEIMDVYVGAGDVLAGSARLVQEAHEQAEENLRQQEFERQQARLTAERKALETQMAALQARLIAASQDQQVTVAQEARRREQLHTQQAAMARNRQGDVPAHDGSGSPLPLPRRESHDEPH
jgi:circadian clock protein KaiC